MNRSILGVLIAAGAMSAAPSAAWGQALTVYSSLPLQGASRGQTTAVVHGEQLALEEAGGVAGGRPITLKSLDDSTAAAGAWTPEAAAADGRRAAQDPSAVAYIGEFNSGATKVSLPILNEAGIPMLSPGNTYTGLTRSGPDTEKGEPEKYYPTGARTYFRLQPNDSVQGGALAAAMHARGCTRVSVLTDGDTYGAGLGGYVRTAARALGMRLVKSQRINPNKSNYRGLARAVRRARANCVAYTGITANNAVQLLKDVGRALPKAELFGGDGIAETGFVRPKDGGVPASVGRRVTVTVSTPPAEVYSPAAVQFAARYTARFNARYVDPYAVAGYDAMRLVLDAINAVGPDRAAITAWLHGLQARPGLMGTYGFDANGDTTLRTYALYRIRAGNLVYAGVVSG